MATDTRTPKLIINDLTKEQFEAITNPSDTELYLVPDDTDEKLALKQDVLSEGEGISIDDNEISVKTDGVSIEFNSDGELISGVKETAFRGEFATWAFVPEDEDNYLPDHNQSSTPTANDYIVISDASDYENTSFTIKFTKPQENRISFYLNDQLIWTINSQGESTSLYEGPYGDLNIYNDNGNLDIVGLRNFNSTKEGEDEPVRVLTRGLLQVEWKDATTSYEYTIEPIVPATDGKWVFYQVSSDFSKSHWLPAYRLDKDTLINFTSGNHVVAEYDQETNSYKLESKSLLPTIDRDTMYDPAEDREIKVFTDTQKIVVWEDISRDGTRTNERALVPGRFYRNTRQEETAEMIEVIRVENIYNDFDVDETALKAKLEEEYHSGVGQLRVMYWTASNGEIIQAIELYDYITDEVTMYMRTSPEHVAQQLLHYGITLEVVDTSKPCAFYVYFTTGYHPIITTTAGVNKSACHAEVAQFVTAMQNHNYIKIAFTLTVSSNGTSVKVVYTDKWGNETVEPNTYTADEANEYFFDNYGVYLPFYDDDPNSKTGDYVSYTLSSESLLNDWTEVPSPYGGGDKAQAVLNQNSDSSVEALYDWEGTLQEAIDQDVRASHPDWKIYITDDMEGGESVYTKDEVDLALDNKATKSTTLLGYGISDAYTKDEVDELLANQPKDSGRQVGDIFYTRRTDVSFAGAVDCNGSVYNITDYEGDGSIGKLLMNGQLSYVSLSEYATAIRKTGCCDQIGWNGVSNTWYAWTADDTTVYTDTLINPTFAYSHPNDVDPVGDITEHTETTITVNEVVYARDSSEDVEGGLSVTFRVPTLAPRRYIIKSQEPTAENNYTWYRLYNDGWVEQGGKMPSVDTVTIVFPVEMRDTNYNIHNSWLGGKSATFYAADCSISNITTTGYRTQGASNGNVKQWSWHVSGQSVATLEPAERAMIQLFNSTIDEAVATVGTVVAQLGGLDSRTFGIMDYVVDFQAPTAENNYTWYRKYKSGWVEQGGYATINNDNQVTITLPVEMNSDKYHILITANSSGTIRTGGDGNFTATPLSSTQFKWMNGDDFVATNSFWQVTGMAS